MATQINHHSLEQVFTLPPIVGESEQHRQQRDALQMGARAFARVALDCTTDNDAVKTGLRYVELALLLFGHSLDAPV
jgi:hypothetical protein